MPKRKDSDERCDDDVVAVKRPAQQRKQHLYLLVDDWERGYSVRKLDADADAFDSGAGTNPPLTPECFAEPPVARIEAEHTNAARYFVSHGTKIFAMQPGEASPAIPAFEFMFHKDDEHLLREDHKVDAYYYCPPQRRRVLYMTTFGLKYNKEGQLRTTLQRAHACKTYERSYDSAGSMKPLAYWL